MKQITNPTKPIALVTAVAAAALVAVFAFGNRTASAAGQAHAASDVAVGACFDQPNMASALAQLRAARNSLNAAEHDKGGWREKAETATDTAIAQTVAGCSSAK